MEPRRRTAATLPVPAEQAGWLAKMPFVSPVDGSFYFKPEAGTVMVSLSDETPSDPCDAYPDDIDVATALERFHEATIVPRARPTAAWAGLRTFVADGKPVVGFDAGHPGFFWYAGLGGYGIQTSPALSALAAKLISDQTLEPVESSLAAALDPERIPRG
jgi:D-arginine dehydrogenase